MKKTKLLAVVALVLVLTVSIAPVAFAAIWTNRYSDSLLRRSSKVKNSVKNVQLDLNHCISAKLAEDGIFGSKTERAVKTYQLHEWIDDDGIVGNITKDHLWADRDPVTFYKL